MNGTVIKFYARLSRQKQAVLQPVDAKMLRYFHEMGGQLAHLCSNKLSTISCTRHAVCPPSQTLPVNTAQIQARKYIGVTVEKMENKKRQDKGRQRPSKTNAAQLTTLIVWTLFLSTSHHTFVLFSAYHRYIDKLSGRVAGRHVRNRAARNGSRDQQGPVDMRCSHLEHSNYASPSLYFRLFPC